VPEEFSLLIINGDLDATPGVHTQRLVRARYHQGVADADRVTRGDVDAADLVGALERCCCGPQAVAIILTSSNRLITANFFIFLLLFLMLLVV
jgi:hypothetical protein